MSRDLLWPHVKGQGQTTLAIEKKEYIEIEYVYIILVLGILHWSL